MGDMWKAFSAGTNPAAHVHPKAIEVLAEIDVQYKGVPKLVDKFWGMEFDLVIILCEEECPLWLGGGKNVHRSFPDPAETDDIEDFRNVREDIKRQVTAILEDFEQ